MKWIKTSNKLPDIHIPVLAYINNGFFNSFCVVTLNYEHENDPKRKRLWFTSPLPYPRGMGFDLEQILYWQYFDIDIDKEAE